MIHPIRFNSDASVIAGTMALTASGGSSSDRLIRIKVFITVGIIAFSLLAGMAISAGTQASTLNHSEGIIIDFSPYDVTWHDADFKKVNDPVELLKASCAENSYTYTFDDNVLTEVNGISNSSFASWGLWYVKDGETSWTKSDTYDIDSSDYSAVAWAYRSPGFVPTVAVDATGVCIYGYAQSQRIVSLSPVATENLGAVGAVNAIVGVDFYSNYPQKVIDEKNNGMIAVVGTYTDPSFELIMKQDPDMIVSDGSQYNQVQVANSVRQNGTNAVVIYDGTDIQTIYDNLYMVGVATGYDIPAKETIVKDNSALMKIAAKLGSHVTDRMKVMVSLSPDVSPYVAGGGTYVGDILANIFADNAFSSSSGWAHINTEKIAAADPDIIVIVTQSYAPTQSEWDSMYSSLGDSWKLTKAYANKQIYLLCEGATDLASRAAPRYVQLAELLANIIYPGEMGVSDMPRFIGNNYTDYLTITADLG